MQNTNDSIDLDVLFDSLNIGEEQPDDVTTVSIAPHSDVNTAEMQELSPLDVDFFLFDTPADQS